MSQSPDIQKNSDGGISDFGISGQSLIKENCHNSITNDDIDMKLGPVTKLEKRNKTASKKLTITSYQKIVTSKSPKTSTRIRVETGTLCLLFLSSHIFTALEFSHIFTALEFDSKVFWYPSLPIG